MSSEPVAKRVECWLIQACDAKGRWWVLRGEPVFCFKAAALRRRDAICDSIRAKHSEARVVKYAPCPGMRTP